MDLVVFLSIKTRRKVLFIYYGKIFYSGIPERLCFGILCVLEWRHHKDGFCILTWIGTPL